MLSQQGNSVSAELWSGLLWHLCIARKMDGLIDIAAVSLGGNHATSNNLRILNHGRYVVDWSAGYVGATKNRKPLRAWSLCQGLYQLRFEFAMVLRTLGTARKVRIVHEVTTLDCSAKARPLFFRVDADHDRFVFGRKRLKGSNKGMPRPKAAWDISGIEISRHSVFKESDLRIEHSDVDMGTAARNCPIIQCGKYTDGPKQARAEISNRRTDPRGRTVLIAGDAHDSGHGLDDGIKGRPLAIRASLSEARNRSVD